MADDIVFRLRDKIPYGLTDYTLLCAGNQNSDTIVNFRIDQSTGQLNPVGEPIPFGSPVSIVFRDKPLNGV